MPLSTISVADALPDPDWRDALYLESPVALAVLAVDGVIASANRTLAELLGASWGTLVARPWTDFITHEGIEVFRREERRIASPAEDYREFSIHLKLQSAARGVVDVRCHARGLYRKNEYRGCVLHLVPAFTSLTTTQVEPVREPVLHPMAFWQSFVRAYRTEIFLVLVIVALIVGRDALERLFLRVIEQLLS